MGQVPFLLDEMGLDEMGLDEMGWHRWLLVTGNLTFQVEVVAIVWRCTR